MTPVPHVREALSSGACYLNMRAAHTLIYVSGRVSLYYKGSKFHYSFMMLLTVGDHVSLNQYAYHMWAFTSEIITHLNMYTEWSNNQAGSLWYSR